MTIIKELKLSWLTDEEIKNLSFGEIKNSKTFNKNFEPEIGGLFCPQIFGSFQSNQFLKQSENHRIFTNSKIRRWRMAHISLAVPVTNFLILKSILPYVEKISGVSGKIIKDLIYFNAYIVTNKGKSKVLQNKQVLNRKVEGDLIISVLDEIIQTKKISSDVLKEAQELQTNLINQKKNKTRSQKDSSHSESELIFLEDYLGFLQKHWKVKIETGSVALLELLKQIDLKIELKKNLSNDMQRFIQALLKNNLSLTGLIWNFLPVIPAELRPVVKLDEDTLANTQINNFYHKIIIANEKLKEYLKINEKFQTPVLFLDIINNEGRKLQKKVDQLLFEENSYKSNSAKNLLQSLSGKEGIIRKLCLGKRVDYSARSVISPGPNLTLNQLGIPVEIALILFKPFLISLLLKKGHDLEKANQLLLENDPQVFSLLKEAIQNFPVILNRAPTLHRLSIQGFQPVLTLEKTIQLHPLTTVAFNADFDGDQMAIHLPLTKKCRTEIQERMMADSQILDPKNGVLITIPTQDMILGIYYLTRIETNSSAKTPSLYYKLSQIEKEYENKKLDISTPIIVPLSLVKKNLSLKEDNQKFLITTFGRLKFNQILPASFVHYINDLKYYNKYQISLASEDIFDLPLSNWQSKSASGWVKKDIVVFLGKLTRIVSQEEMVEFLDRLKNLSFATVTQSGISISLFELPKISEKETILRQSWTKFHQIEQHYKQGFYSEKEFIQQKNELWTRCKSELEEKIIQSLKQKDNTSLYCLWESGARTSNENLTQIFGMRGNMTDYKGNLIEFPIFSSLKEGLNPFEFFISAYGAMKGMMDTALKTAEAGYLTRQLVETVQNIIITSQDCQTKEGILLQELKEESVFKDSKKILMGFGERIHGRYLAQDIVINNQKILAADTFLLKEEISLLQKNNVSAVKVRSPFTCSLIQGICQKCYGLNLSKNDKIIELGTAVGIIAAQSLGEPGTQLTMRTFHTGGVASEEDITQGLPKVKEIFGNILPNKKNQMVLAQENGEITEIIEDQKKQQITIKQKTSEKEINYTFEAGKRVKVKVGQMVQKGESLTSGKINLANLLEAAGRETCQNYIKEEIWKVYYNQGIIINEKHIELFTRKMLGNVEITNPGSSNYLVGDNTVNYQEFCHVNQQIREKNKDKKGDNLQPVQAIPLMFNLRQIAKNSSSFLASVSFQDTLKNLVNYSIFQPVDRLQGIKENLIVGQLVPIGSGFEKHQELTHKREKVIKNIINKKST